MPAGWSFVERSQALAERSLVVPADELEWRCTWRCNAAVVDRQEAAASAREDGSGASAGAGGRIGEAATCMDYEQRASRTTRSMRQKDWDAGDAPREDTWAPRPELVCSCVKRAANERHA